MWVKVQSSKARYAAKCLARRKHKEDLEFEDGGRRWNDNHLSWFSKENSGFTTPIQDIFNAAYEQNLTNGKIFEKDLIWGSRLLHPVIFNVNYENGIFNQAPPNR